MITGYRIGCGGVVVCLMIDLINDEIEKAVKGL